MSSGIHDRDEVSPPVDAVGSILHHMHLLLFLSCYNHFEQEVRLKYSSKEDHKVQIPEGANR